MQKKRKKRYILISKHSIYKSCFVEFYSDFNGEKSQGDFHYCIKGICCHTFFITVMRIMNENLSHESHVTVEKIIIVLK